MQVLIVDDDEFALEVLENTMSRMGYSCVRALNGNEALECLRSSEIRLVVTDWEMPGMNGLDLCRAVRREELSGYVYVIMLTGREGSKRRLEGLCAGADDFLNKPLDPEELVVCLKTAERILSLETRDLALFALAKLAESRDPDTGAHIERVQGYCRLIAQNLSAETRQHYGVDDEFIRLLHQTSALHDLGKVGIPDAVLLKRGKLTSDEFAIMKTHALLGAQTLEAALQRYPNARFLQMARDIAATHHEKFDGSGYPLGLVADQIPLPGRLVALADVYDALTSKRVYKDAMNHEQAKAVILKDRGSHFDPEVVDAFLRAEPKLLVLASRLRDGEAPAPSAAIPPAPPSADTGLARPSKILVVDDEPDILDRTVELLGATGEHIFSASSGEEALKIIAEHRPRLVVSDWVMSGTDGVELCRRIRATDGDQPVHFIMLTAHTEKSRLLEAYSAGANDFISKPFDPEELLARVRAGLRAAMLHEELLRKSNGSQALNAHLAKLNSRLERLSVTDELTGLFNRRHAMSRLEEQWSLAERYGRPLTIAMLDVDHFKKINDTYGHEGGDAILRQVAVLLRDATRGTDVVCRVGGEEFLIIFPQQTIQEAIICAERCRKAMSDKPFTLTGTTANVTISIGLATRNSRMTQFTDLLKTSDDALYAAKNGGRNLVVTSDQLENKTMENNNAPAPQPAAPKSADTQAAPAAAPPPAPKGPPIDPATVLKRCGGSPAFAGKIMDRYASGAIGEIEQIERALAAGDADLFRRSAHSLKSMSAYVSADSASSLAAQLEELGREGRLTEAQPAVVELRKQVTRVTAWIIEYRAANAAKCA